MTTRVPSAPGPGYDPKWMYWFWDWVKASKGAPVQAITGGGGITVTTGTGGAFALGNRLVAVGGITGTTTTGTLTAAIGTFGGGAILNNLLTNPNWQLDQKNEGALYTVSTTGVRGPDGWSASAVGAGVFKVRTLADPDNAALKCLEITCTTADGTIASTDDYFLFTAVEGFDAAALKAGTAGPLAVTIQFKFKTNVTGVYGLSIANSALDRRYVGIITVADANENDYSLTLTMDATGTWLYTNGVGFYLRLCLAAGTDFHGTAGAWAAGAQQTTVAQVNFMSVNTNVAYLKRIMAFQGTVAQAYPTAEMSHDLDLAQRYFQKSYSQGTPVALGTTFAGARRGVAIHTGDFYSYGDVRFVKDMRAPPTITVYSPQTGSAGVIYDLSQAADKTSVTENTSAISYGQRSVTMTNGDGCQWHFTADARLS